MSLILFFGAKNKAPADETATTTTETAQATEEAPKTDEKSHTTEAAPTDNTEIAYPLYHYKMPFLPKEPPEAEANEDYPF